MADCNYRFVHIDFQISTLFTDPTVFLVLDQVTMMFLLMLLFVYFVYVHSMRQMLCSGRACVVCEFVRAGGGGGWGAGL